MPNTPEVFLSQRSVITQIAGVQDELQITELVDGRILMSWRSESDVGAGSPSGTDIIGQMFDPFGARIGGEFRLNQFYSTDDQSHHSVAALDTGGWVVTYQDADTATSIRVETYDQLGNRTDARSIQNDNNSNFPNYANPVIAHSGGSSVIVAYEGILAAAGTNPIYFRSYNPVTDTVGPQNTLFTTAGAFGLDFSSVQIEALDNGNYVAVAQFHNTGIHMRIISPSGTTVLAQTSVAATASNGEIDINPQVAALTGGGYVVTWQNEASDTDVFYQTFSSTGSAVGPIRINASSSTNENTEPQVAGLDDGGFVLFWNNLDADALRLQRYDASGVPVGSEITVVADADVAHVHTVETLSDGRFIVGYRGILGEPRFVIYDPRDEATYNSDKNVIGTIGNDFFSYEATSFGNPAQFDGVEIFTFDGNDTIDLTHRSGLDLTLIDGGRGTDTVILADLQHFNYNENIGSLVDLRDGEIGGTVSIVPVTLTSIENIIGSVGNDEIRGDDEANLLQGGAGDDYIFGRGGNDTVQGGSGHDTLVAGAGVDVLSGGADNDLLMILDNGGGAGSSFAGNSGVDTLKIQGGNYNTFTVNMDAFIFSSLEKLEYGGVRVEIQASQLLGFQTVAGVSSFEGRLVAELGTLRDADFSFQTFTGDSDLTVLGNNQDNVIGAFTSTTADDGIQYLYGGAGHDTIAGNEGYDSIGGGGGNDVIFGQGGSDTINGASGHDYIDGGAGSDVIYSGNGNDTLLGGSGNDDLFITSGSATVDGGQGADTIYFNVSLSELLNNPRFYSITGGAAATEFDLLDFRSFGAGVGIQIVDSIGIAYTDGEINGTVDPSDEIFQFTNMLAVGGSEYNDIVNAFDEKGSGEISTVYGRGGHDTLIGGLETRWLYGGLGDDTLDGSALAVSSVIGANGLLEVAGGMGNDSIVGSDFYDIIFGGHEFGGNEPFEVNSDNDTIFGGAGADRIYGDHEYSSTLTFFPYIATAQPFDPNEDPHFETTIGGGDDVIYGGDGADRIFGDYGNDYLVGGPERWSGGEEDTDTLVGGRGDDTLLGGADRDELLGGMGADSLVGGRGDDVLIGGEGADTMQGSGGFDQVVYYDVFEQDTIGVVVDLESGTGSAGHAAGDVFSGIEALVGSRFADEITSGAGGFYIRAGDGSDTVFDAGGSDTINGGEGDDLIVANKGQNIFTGGAGTDTISYRYASGGVEINLETNVTGGNWAQTDSISQFENAFGSNNGGDVIVGTSGANEIRTYRGRDEVSDGAGDDYVSLGKGNDTVNAGRGTDEYNGANGTDLIIFATAINVDLDAGTAVNEFGEIDTLFGFENVTGSNFDDVISGDNEKNLLRGQQGDDTIDGGASHDSLEGGSGKDVLIGGNGRDTLMGDGGADTLDGGNGNDVLFGGSGDDVFVYRSDAGHDTISDWDRESDSIDLVAFKDPDIDGVGVQMGDDVYYDFGADGELTILNAIMWEVEETIRFMS